MLITPDNFVIVHRDRSAKPDFIYPPDSRLAACIARSINYSQGFLRLARVQDTFMSYAKDYTQSEPNAWYKDPAYGYKNIEHLVSDFINTLRADFFLTCIDFSITNPNLLGGSANREWHGSFSPRDHSIILNGSRVDDMVAAATRAFYSQDYNDYDNKELRTFLFIITNTFFHETCHLFTTFLTKGRTTTPPHYGVQVDGYSKPNKGEFGRYMETVVFGGTLEYYRDHTRGAGQSGIPHIVNKHGARKISQQTIDAIVDGRNIGTEYPIILAKQYIDPHTMENLGKHLPPSVLTDPMNWKIMNEFKKHNHRAHVSTQSRLYGPSFHQGYPGGGW